MANVKKYRYLLRALFGLGILLIFLTATNPNNLALGLLVVPVLLISFVAYELIRYILFIFWGDNRRNRQQAIGLILAVSVGILLMLQSIGQLVVGDFAIIIFFALVSVFYASRFR